VSGLDRLLPLLGVWEGPAPALDEFVGVVFIWRVPLPARVRWAEFPDHVPELRFEPQLEACAFPFAETWGLGRVR